MDTGDEKKNSSCKDGWRSVIIYIFRPLTDFFYYWFNCPSYTLMAQVILSFCYGLLLGPLASGIWILTWTNIIYEFFAFCFTRQYIVFVRAAVICASMLGWIVGRTLSQDEVMVHGKRFF